MEIPIDKVLRSLLTPGNVFYFVEPTHSSAEPHNFVLLNRVQSEQSRLYFLVGTSNVTGARRRRQSASSQTVVVVDPAEHADFTKSTAFDCNQVIDKSYAEFSRLIAN